MHPNPTLVNMTQPIEVDLAHSLGKAEARRRIADNVGSLKDHMPGQVADVHHAWNEDTLNLTIGAMGQEVLASIEVREADVHVKVELPGMLALFAQPIAEALKRKGGDLLLEDRRDDD